jgi:outer membrane protein assembly factor BamD
MMSRRLGLVVVLLGCALAGAFAEEARAASRASKKRALVPPDQAYEHAVGLMAKKKYFKARTELQEILPRIPPEDRDLLPKVQLAIADAFYKDGGLTNYGEALNGYRNFLTYFPQHEKAAYAQFMVGQSMAQQVLAPDRDQTMTLKAIDELRRVETAHPDSPYAAQAGATIDRCQSRLAEKERVIGHFYQRRKSWLAAIDRYRAVLKDYPRYTDTNRVILDLGSSLLQINQRDEAQDLFDRLAREDSTGRLSRRAKSALADYDRRREKEGEQLYGNLSKENKKKGTTP